MNAATVLAALPRRMRPEPDDALAQFMFVGVDKGSTGEPPAEGCGDPPVWCPTPGLSWQWQLSGAIDDSVDVAMYDIDLFDNEAGQISTLHDDGRVVICYFSAGSHEDWRPDADQFPAGAIGAELDGWPGERWLDVRHAGWPGRRRPR